MASKTHVSTFSPKKFPTHGMDVPTNLKHKPEDTNLIPCVLVASSNDIDPNVPGAIQRFRVSSPTNTPHCIDSDAPSSSLNSSKADASSLFSEHTPNVQPPSLEHPRSLFGVSMPNATQSPKESPAPLLLQVNNHPMTLHDVPSSMPETASPYLSKPGWCSIKHCSFPQWIIFRLGTTPSNPEIPKVHAIQILFHHFKIPSIVELWSTHLSKESVLEASSETLYDFLQDSSVEWFRLGHIVPSTNVSSHFRARELKTIPIQFKANFVKFVFHKAYANVLNIWKQVSVAEVRFTGPSDSAPVTTSPVQLDTSPFLAALSFIVNEKKKFALQENFIQADEFKKLHERLTELVKVMKDTKALKEKESAAENYVQAEQHKQRLKALIHQFYSLTLQHGILVDPTTGHTSIKDKGGSSTPIEVTPIDQRSMTPTTPAEKMSMATVLQSPPVPANQRSLLSTSIDQESNENSRAPTALKSVVTIGIPTAMTTLSLTETASPMLSASLSTRSATKSISHVPPNGTTLVQLSPTIAPSSQQSLSFSSSSTFFTAVPSNPPSKVEGLFEPPLPATSDVKETYLLKSTPPTTRSPISPLLNHEQAIEYGACIDLVGNEILSLFLAKDFDTKERGLREVQDFLHDRSNGLEAIIVLKGGFTFIEKTLMDPRERVACWSFQIWNFLTKYSSLSYFWQSTYPMFLQLLTRAGDLNPRVSKAAHELAVALLVKHPSTLVPMILNAFPPTVQWRLIKSRFHLICDTLDDVGLSHYDLDSLKSLISDHLAHTHHEVREVTTHLLLRLAQWVDAPSLEPCLDAISQKFHRQALRIKLYGVQRRAVSVMENPTSPPLPSPRRAVTPNFTNKKKSWTRWFGKPLSHNTEKAKRSKSTSASSKNSSLSPSNVTSPMSHDTACIFCEEAHPDFNIPANMDLHYLKECPLLSECPQCETIIEITQYRDHYANECNGKKHSVPNLTEGNCPLCRTPVNGKSEVHLLRHLLTGSGCPKSKRKPRPGAQYKSKLQ